MTMAKRKKKVSIIGAGNIGGALAAIVAESGLADVVLLDINGAAAGKALDLSQSMAICGSDVNVSHSLTYDATEGSDVIVVTAGVPRKPGMSRDDLLEINSSIIKSVAEDVAKYCPNAFVIVLTNPLDTMVGLFQHASKMPHNMVVGMAGVLDSARMEYFLSQEFGVSKADVCAMVLGGHGDTMVPMLNYTTVSGIKIMDLVKLGMSTEEKINEIVERTRNGGAEIVKLLGNGSAFFAPARSAFKMAKSFMMDEKKVMPCAAWLNGEYGVKDLYIGVPVVIGAKGVESVIELELTNEEQKMFQKSVSAVKESGTK